jgi:hypothetical protein
MITSFRVVACQKGIKLFHIFRKRAQLLFFDKFGCGAIVAILWLAWQRNRNGIENNWTTFNSVLVSTFCPYWLKMAAPQSGVAVFFFLDHAVCTLLHDCFYEHCIRQLNNIFLCWPANIYLREGQTNPLYETSYRSSKQCASRHCEPVII